MHKKIIAACTAIAAFAAFVVAPAASAATLTENGTAVKVGASITGKSSGQAIITAGELSFVCTNTHVHGTVTANASGTIAGEIPVGGLSLPGTGTGEDCTSSLGPVKPTMTTKLCLHIAKGTDIGTMTGCGGVIKFTLHVTNLGLECKYEAPNISGTIATSPTDAEVKGVEQAVTREGTTFLCPESAKIDTQWVMTTTDGTTLQFS
ncbi:MAG TPA: hypothetical protein VFP21_01145 [Solirubrobacterales bacterium]|nr:hypothetical protein [Solirubrobacterales bacterium]